MGFFDNIAQSAKKKAFQICLNKYDVDGQKGLNADQLAGFLTQMCKLLGVPLTCSKWQAKLAMRAIDNNSNGIADVDQLYKLFLKAQGIITGQNPDQLKKLEQKEKSSSFKGPDWHEDGKLGYGKSQGIGQGLQAGSLGY